MKFETSSCATACCEPACFEGVITGPWPSCLVETCYSRTTVTPGTPSGANGSFVVDSVVDLPDQLCSMSTTGTADGADTFPAPWFTVGSVMAIRDDNGICPNDVGMLRLDAGDRIGVSYDLREGVIYAAGAAFRKISNDGLGSGSVQVIVTKPDGTTQSFGPIVTNRVGGNAGWDWFGFGRNNSLFTATEAGTYTVEFESLGPAPVRMIHAGIQIVDNSGEVVDPIITVDYFRSETVGDVTAWFDRNGNTVSQPTGELVAIDCPLP